MNVLEVGFNAGLGAAAFLEASPQVHVVSFDLAEHPFVAACAEHLRSRPRALVIVDDLMPHTAYGIGVCRAWDELLRERVLALPEIWRARPGAAAAEADAGEPPEGCERRWGVARFNTG